MEISRKIHGICAESKANQELIGIADSAKEHNARANSRKATTDKKKKKKSKEQRDLQ